MPGRYGRRAGGDAADGFRGRARRQLRRYPRHHGGRDDRGRRGNRSREFLGGGLGKDHAVLLGVVGCLVLRSGVIGLFIALLVFLPAVLIAAAGVLADWLAGAGKDVPLADVARTLTQHRSRFKTVAAVCARDRAGAIAGLQAQKQ